MGKKTSLSPAASSKGKTRKLESSAKRDGRVQATFTIQNTLGLHARAAALFVKVANRYRANITVRRDAACVNGKSIMGVLMLAAANGTKIDILAEGPDAAEAVKELGKLIGERFGEH